MKAAIFLTLSLTAFMFLYACKNNDANPSDTSLPTATLKLKSGASGIEQEIREGGNSYASLERALVITGQFMDNQGVKRVNIKAIPMETRNPLVDNTQLEILDSIFSSNPKTVDFNYSYSAKTDPLLASIIPTLPQKFLLRIQSTISDISDNNKTLNFNITVDSKVPTIDSINSQVGEKGMIQPTKEGTEIDVDLFDTLNVNSIFSDNIGVRNIEFQAFYGGTGLSNIDGQSISDKTDTTIMKISPTFTWKLRIFIRINNDAIPPDIFATFPANFHLKTRMIVTDVANNKTTRNFRVNITK